MESAYCLWSTYSWWVNISQLRPLFFFPAWPQPEKVLAGLAKSLSRAWYWLCVWLDFSSSLLLCRASCSGVKLLVRAPGWYYCMLCFCKYRVLFGPIFGELKSVSMKRSVLNCSKEYPPSLRTTVCLVSLNNLLSHNGKLPPNEHQYLTVWHPLVPI